MYCENCKKQIPDGKFCVFCGKEMKNKHKLTGINLFQTLMTILIAVWTIMYIVVSVLVVYNANGKKGGYDDYSIAISFFVIMFDFFVIPCLIAVNQCIITGKNQSNNIDKRKIIAIILIIFMIIFSIAALWYDDNSLGMAIKLYFIPIVVYSVISLINIIIKIVNKKNVVKI